MQLVAKNHLLSISYRMNLDYQEEVYFIINSIEAAMIHFENKSAKQINQNLINLLQGSISNNLIKQLVDKDLKFSSNNQTTQQLNAIINNFQKKKIFRVYQTPQQLEKMENRASSHTTSHFDNKKASSENDGSIFADRSVNNVSINFSPD
jgi:hypothetical protein